MMTVSGEEENLPAGFTAEVTEDSEWRRPGGLGEYFSCMAFQ